MSGQLSDSDDALSDDDPLLRAVARGPRAENALEHVALPRTVRLGVGDLDPSAPSTLPGQGDVIDGRYRIDARLGSGGMGVVFSATHLQTKKRVALKWMHSGLRLRSESEQLAARRRFEREARMAARVRHPNVVDVYDASSDARGSYLVMELLSGETLGTRMRRGKLRWDEALALLLPAMRGVAALHAQGVIHRDLKPENIYLAQTEDGATQPKVLDFGVAALRAMEQEEQDETLTGPGAVLGTPGYMSLEQLRGERMLDVRTDVYALGVVLYEALSGTRPVRAGNAAEHAAKLASEQPIELAALVAELRGARSDAVMKALHREREQRHESVHRLVEALNSARPAAARTRTVALCALAIAVVVLAVASLLPREAPRSRQTAESAHAPPSRSASGVTTTRVAERPNPASEDVKRPDDSPQLHPRGEAEDAPTSDGTPTHEAAPSNFGSPEPRAAIALSRERATPVQPSAQTPSRRVGRGTEPASVGAKSARALESRSPPTAPAAQRDRATSMSRDDF